MSESPQARYLVYVIGRPYMNRKYYARSNALELVEKYKHKGWDARMKQLFPAWDDGNYNEGGMNMEGPWGRIYGCPGRDRKKGVPFLLG